MSALTTHIYTQEGLSPLAHLKFPSNSSSRRADSICTFPTNVPNKLNSICLTIYLSHSFISPHHWLTLSLFYFFLSFSLKMSNTIQKMQSASMQLSQINFLIGSLLAFWLFLIESLSVGCITAWRRQACWNRTRPNREPGHRGHWGCCPEVKQEPYHWHWRSNLKHIPCRYNLGH